MRPSHPNTARKTATIVVSIASVCFAVAGLPSSATAQVPNDDYGNAFQINPLPNYTWYTQNPSGATTQMGENTQCVPVDGGSSVFYDTTVWYDLYPNRPGNLTVDVQGSGDFVPLVGVMRFDANAQYLNEFKCVPAGGLRYARLDYWRYFRLREGAGYKVQVGRVSGTASMYRIDFYFDPDTDRDGPVDSADACNTEPGGPNSIGGCPDGDNDDIRDLDDQCDVQPAGARGIRGCPDTDGDGLVDQPDPGSGLVGDVCDREDVRKGTDENGNGCLDYRKLQPNVKLNWATNFVRDDGRYVRNGVKLDPVIVTEISRGTRVEVRCSSRTICKKKTKRARRRGRVVFKSLDGEKLLPGQRIIVRVTGDPLSIGKWVRFKAKPRGQKGHAKSARCIDPRTGRARPCRSVSTLR